MYISLLHHAAVLLNNVVQGEPGHWDACKKFSHIAL
jgi:hypothetical protein